MKYKIHTAYINNNGTVISAGIYDESELDLAEARHKSIVTVSDIDIPTTTTYKDIVKKVELKNEFREQEQYFKEINIEPELNITNLEFIDINHVSEEKLSKIKYVSKANAKKVISERNSSLFNSYIDLDKRVPLSFNRKWQDICAIEFKLSDNIAKQQLEFITA